MTDLHQNLIRIHAAEYIFTESYRLSDFIRFSTGYLYSAQQDITGNIHDGETLNKIYRTMQN